MYNTHTMAEIEEEKSTYKHDIAATLEPFATELDDKHLMTLFGIATRFGRETHRLTTTLPANKSAEAKRIRDQELDEVAKYISSHGGVGLLAGLEKHWMEKPADKKTGFSLANTYSDPERRRIARMVISTEDNATSDPKRKVDLFVLGTNLKTII